MRRLLFAALLAACPAPAPSAPPTTPTTPLPPERTVQSDDVLDRAPRTTRARVKHVLIGWRDLAPAYNGDLDPRAAGRSFEEASAMAAEVLEKLRGGFPVESMMARWSEDPGSAASGEAYEVTPDAALVPEFKDLSLRLDVGEAGVVRTRYGWHVIVRVE